MNRHTFISKSVYNTYMKSKMSEEEIEKELEELIKKYEDLNPDEQVIKNENIYTLIYKPTESVTMKWTRMNALKTLRKWVNIKKVKVG